MNIDVIIVDVLDGDIDGDIVRLYVDGIVGVDWLMCK